MERNKAAPGQDFLWWSDMEVLKELKIVVHSSLKSYLAGEIRGSCFDGRRNRREPSQANTEQFTT